MSQIIPGIWKPQFIIGGVLRGANMATTADQFISLSWPGPAYMINGFFFFNQSVNPTASVGGFYTGAGKTGFIIVSSTTAYTNLSTTSLGSPGSILNPSTIGATTVAHNSPGVYFSLTTPHNAPCTVDIYAVLRTLF